MFFYVKRTLLFGQGLKKKTNVNSIQKRALPSSPQAHSSMILRYVSLLPQIMTQALPLGETLS